MAEDKIELVTALPRLAARPADSNKGDFGRVLVVAGSTGMAGAAVLCATAALRGGAGLVRVAVPHDILPTVAAGHPCYTSAPLPQDAAGRLVLLALQELMSLSQESSVVAIGPGLGRSHEISTMLADYFVSPPRPVVLDADGLNAFVDQPERLRGGDVPIIVTPHPGEFARLLGVETAAVQRDRQALAMKFARERQLIVVLKGHGTLVTDGRRVYRNPTGNAGMATGGTGDVLTGLIAALVGQGLEPFAAAQLGVYLHGVAGDLARDQVGEVSVLATDLLDFLPPALRHYQAGTA